MSDDVKDNLTSTSTWKRGFIMLLFAVLSYVTAGILFLVALFQFLLKLFSGDTNKRLREFGRGMSSYLHQIFQYLTFNSDFEPYPFGDWPGGESGSDTKPAPKPKATKKASEKKITRDGSETASK